MCPVRCATNNKCSSAIEPVRRHGYALHCTALHCTALLPLSCFIFSSPFPIPSLLPFLSPSSSSSRRLHDHPDFIIDRYKLVGSQERREMRGERSSHDPIARQMDDIFELSALMIIIVRPDHICAEQQSTRCTACLSSCLSVLYACLPSCLSS